MGEFMVKVHFPDNCKYLSLKIKHIPWGVMEDLKAFYSSLQNTGKIYKDTKMGITLETT